MDEIKIAEEVARQAAEEIKRLRRENDDLREELKKLRKAVTVCKNGK